MRLSFAVAALFGMAAANTDAVTDVQVAQEAEPELTFLSEEDSEKMLEDDAELNAQTHRVAEAEVNKLAQAAKVWGSKVKKLTGVEKNLKTKNWNHLMKKTQYWKKLRAGKKAKFHALMANMKKGAKVTDLKNGRKEFHFVNEKALATQIKALRKADRHMKMVIKRDIQVYFKNEQKINNYLKGQYKKNIKASENNLKVQAKKTVKAVKNDINMVEEDEIIDHRKMSLTETIACSAVFVFSCAALAAAALYDPKKKAAQTKKVVVDNEVAPTPKKQIKKTLDNILKSNNTKVTLM